MEAPGLLTFANLSYIITHDVPCVAAPEQGEFLLIKIKSRLGRFVTCVISAGATLAAFVVLGAAALVGNPNENAVPPCKVTTYDGTVLLLSREEANASQLVNANGIAQDPMSQLSAAEPTCTP